MKNIREFYFSLCRYNESGYVILLIKKNKQDYIFYVNEEDEILNRIKNENPKDAIAIYISNRVSKELLIQITDILDVTIYVSSKNQSKLKNVKYCNQFTKIGILENRLKTVIELCENNKYFKECFDTLSNKDQSSEKTIKKLATFKIIDYENDNVFFTEYGKLIFVDDDKMHREITITNTSIHNSLYFKSEKSFIGPLFQLINTASTYLSNIIPNVQERNGTHSKIFKLLDSRIAKEIVFYCICHNDFSKNETINIELTQTSVNISFLESNSMIIKNFFEYYTNTKVSYDELYNECKKNEISITMKKNNKNYVKMKIYLSHNVKEIDDDLDNLDFEIILFAKNNPNFTRKMIDQTFNISPRNSNIRIKQMLDKNILKSSGINKAIRYNYNDLSKK